MADIGRFLRDFAIGATPTSDYFARKEAFEREKGYEEQLREQDMRNKLTSSFVSGFMLPEASAQRGLQRQITLDQIRAGLERETQRLGQRAIREEREVPAEQFEVGTRMPTEYELRGGLMGKEYGYRAGLLDKTQEHDLTMLREKYGLENILRENDFGRHMEEVYQTQDWRTNVLLPKELESDLKRIQERGGVEAGLIEKRQDFLSEENQKDFIRTLYRDNKAFQDHFKLEEKRAEERLKIEAEIRNLDRKDPMYQEKLNNLRWQNQALGIEIEQMQITRQSAASILAMKQGLPFETQQAIDYELAIAHDAINQYDGFSHGRGQGQTLPQYARPILQQAYGIAAGLRTADQIDQLMKSGQFTEETYKHIEKILDQNPGIADAINTHYPDLAKTFAAIDWATTEGEAGWGLMPMVPFIERRKRGAIPLSNVFEGDNLRRVIEEYESQLPK